MIDESAISKIIEISFRDTLRNSFIKLFQSSLILENLSSCYGIKLLFQLLGKYCLVSPVGKKSEDDELVKVCVKLVKVQQL